MRAKFINENNTVNITYKISTDEDRIIITAFINSEKVGILIMEVLTQSYEYEFEDVFTEEEFNEIYPDDIIIKIEHIVVDDFYKNQGIGSELIKRGIKLMKQRGFNQFYLNASPMGYSGLNTHDLVQFYKKFGFKELLHQGHNVLMGVVFK